MWGSINVTVCYVYGVCVCVCDTVCVCTCVARLHRLTLILVCVWRRGYVRHIPTPTVTILPPNLVPGTGTSIFISSYTMIFIIACDSWHGEQICFLNLKKVLLLTGIIVMLTDKARAKGGGRIKRGRRGEEGSRCRCYGRQRGKDWGDWNLTLSRWTGGRSTPPPTPRLPRCYHRGDDLRTKGRRWEKRRGEERWGEGTGVL